ncbi:MAG: thiamine pyrophosphate-binding protein, partial [Bacteroidales bacterium]|nr:thiamine pyrophosphate-binding protein [Bacteroidales bacterium]
MKKEKINGAEALLRTIEAEGIDTIFGYPGGTIIPIYDKLYDWPGNLKHILVRHEQGAVHAAEGYARSTGKVGVCMATAGPGATNFITGIADAMMDSTPVICITAQVNADKLGTNFFQETDMIGITIPITKWNRQITSAHEIPAVMAQAFHIARSGRPGPVVISLTKNAQVEMVEYVFNPGKAIRELGLRKVTSREKRITSENIKRATELLNSSRKPLIIAGQGINISLAWKELEELAVQGNIPVATTLLGLGCINSNHPLNVGMVGMHGNIAPNSMTQQADVILAVGMRFSDRVTGDIKGYAPRARIIHIDIDRSEFGKNIKAGIKIQADAREVLTQLCQGIQYRDRQEWLDFAKEK